MNKLNFNYTLTRKNVKNINCRIKEGNVIVSANENISIEKIEKFLFSKSDLITKAIENQSKKPELLLENNSTIKLLKNEYLLRIHSSNKNYISLSENTINIFTKDTSDKELINHLFNSLLKDFSKKTIEPICAETFISLARYNIPTPKVKYKKLKSMWGNCNAQKCTITFSTNLMFTNIDFVKYVVLHEYVHLIHQHHQKPFYDVIKKIMPNYKEIKGSLYE